MQTCIAQLMPLPLTVSCFSKIQIGFTFLVPAHPGSLGQRAVKRVCVCVCVARLSSRVAIKTGDERNRYTFSRREPHEYIGGYIFECVLAEAKRCRADARIDRCILYARAARRQRVNYLDACRAPPLSGDINRPPGGGTGDATPRRYFRYIAIPFCGV